MALNIGLDTSFSGILECEGMWEKEWEVNSTKVYMADYGNFVEYSMAVTLIYINLFFKM
jgi:hypothetical protein